MSVAVTARPSVVLIGTPNPPEFDAVTGPLEDTADWQHFTQVDKAIAWLVQSVSRPDLMVLLQSRPGEIADADVRRLQTAAPLSGICAVLGSWCEGEPRTGQPWLGVERCYQHEWPLRWHEEVRRRVRGELPLWAMPATASAEERLLSRTWLSCNGGRAATVAVVARSLETTSALSDACHAGRLSVQSSDVNVVLWDTTCDDAKNSKLVTALKAKYAGARLIALVTFPRMGDLMQMQVAGVDAVLARPLLLNDLLAEIERLS